jgi:AraC-like DNA-binding protein
MPVAPQTAAAIAEGLARVGIDPASLGVPRLTEDAHLALLWRRAIRQAGRSTIPLEVGLVLPLGTMGPIDYLAASSGTVGAAFTLTQQVFPLVGPGVQLEIDATRGGGRRLTIVDHPPFPGQAASDSFVVGVLLGRARLFAGKPLEVTRVELSEPEPAASGPWKALLGVPVVRFGARRATIHLTSRSWSTPLRSADARLLAVLRGAVGLDQQSGDALLVAVRSLAVQRLPGLLDLDYAARALGMSRRTLQRRLAASGTALQALVDEARRDKAEQLVTGGHFTLGEVAAQLGFAEQASLSRAFRRWFGSSPSAWRARPLNTPARSGRPIGSRQRSRPRG